MTLMVLMSSPGRVDDLDPRCQTSERDMRILAAPMCDVRCAMSSRRSPLNVRGAISWKDTSRWCMV